MHAGERPKNAGEWMRGVETKHANLERRLRAQGARHAAATSILTTDGSGNAAVAFGVSFADVPVVILTGYLGQVATLVGASADGFLAHFNDPAGSPVVSSPVTLNWAAYPATT